MLVSLFVTLYLLLFRSELRFPRALWLYPVGIAASMAFNVLRISVLLVIGFEGNPALAVGGFHSHAGWLAFTLVALGILALAQTVPALRRVQSDRTSAPGTISPVQPFLRDPVVAYILPFAIFMFSALLANVMSQTPGVVYPARVLLMAGVLVLFWRVYLALTWRLDIVAVLAGALVGIAWVLIPADAGDGTPPYGALTGAGLVLWMLLRGIGTVLFVPVIEELFFRGYLEQRLRLGDGLRWTLFAAFLSAGLFAALHDRWAEAFLAGLVFSWVMSRSGSVTSAILAHAVANLIVFAAAAASGQWHMILSLIHI